MDWCDLVASEVAPDYFCRYRSVPYHLHQLIPCGPVFAHRNGFLYPFNLWWEVIAAMLDIACKFCSWVRDLAHEAFKPQASLSVSAGGNNTVSGVPSTGIKAPVIASNPAPIPAQKLQTDHQLNPTRVNNLPMYIDSRGTPVNLAGASFVGGAQGDIYNITGHADKVCKIYKDIKLVNQKGLKSLSLKGEIVHPHPDLMNHIGRTLNESAHFAWPSIPVFLLADFNIVNKRLHDHARIVGFVTMKAEGETLADFLDATGKGLSRLGGDSSSLLAWLKIAYNLTLTVAYAHSAGFVVSDMAPKNFIICKKRKPDGSDYFHITMIDTDSFSIPAEKCYFYGGTPGYIAPERVTSRMTLAPSESSDLFTLGVILFQLLFRNIHPMEITPGGTNIFEGANLCKFAFSDPASMRFVHKGVLTQWNSLSDSLKGMFVAALGGGVRPNSFQWLHALDAEINRMKHK